MILIFILTSCGKEEKPSASSSHLEVLRIEISGADNETVFQNFTYKRSNSIVVTAYYSDSSSDDVTSKAVFIKVNTTNVGPQEAIVTYTYYGKTVESSYEVNVLPYGVEELKLDSTSVKKIYEVGQKLDLTGLRVTGTYSSGSESIIKNYDVWITDINNRKQSKDSPFTKAGSYDVVISYQGGNASYSVKVYEKTAVSYHYLVTNSIDYLKDADSDFTASKAIFKSPYAYVVPNGSNIKYDYDEASYDNNTYEAGLKISPANPDFENTEDLKGVCIQLLKPADLIIVLNNKNLIVRTMDDRVISYTGNKIGMTTIFVSLEEGAYYLNSFEDSIIYDILFNIHDVDDYEHYDKLEINLSHLKREYSYFEALDVSNLELYGVLGDSKSLIDSTEYKIEMLYNNSIVSHFWYEGDYQIRITYLGDKYCYKRSVSYSVSYSIKEVERYYLNLISVDGKELEIKPNQFQYSYNTKNDTIILNLANLAQTDIYVNNELFKPNMVINLVDSTTEINIYVKDKDLFLSYLLVIYKNN